MSGLLKKVVRWFSNPPTETNVEKQRGKRFVNALKEWTGKATATIIYDSTVDEFTADGLFNKVMGKPNVAVIGFTTAGDVFGGFYSVAVTEQEKTFFDPNIFAFSFESRGRCETPQRFIVKEGLREKASVAFLNRGYNFVAFWASCFDGGGFTLGNEMSESYCDDMSNVFEALEDTTLTGKTGLDSENEHHCTRLVAVQLE